MTTPDLREQARKWLSERPEVAHLYGLTRDSWAPTLAAFAEHVLASVEGGDEGAPASQKKSNF